MLSSTLARISLYNVLGTYCKIMETIVQVVIVLKVQFRDFRMVKCLNLWPLHGTLSLKGTSVSVEPSIIMRSQVLTPFLNLEACMRTNWQWWRCDIWSLRSAWGCGASSSITPRAAVLAPFLKRMLTPWLRLSDIVNTFENSFYARWHSYLKIEYVKERRILLIVQVEGVVHPI